MSLFVQQSSFTDPIPFEFADRPAPQAGQGEIRIRVSAAGMNPVDWKIATNPVAAEMFGVHLPNAGFGNDFSGVVDQVGDGVDRFALGDRVFGGARGFAVAEHLVLPADHPYLAHTPDGLDDVRAAALDVAGRTADAVVAVTRLSDGDTVVIGGGAGGVGVLAVQLALAAGATVVATASELNHDFLRELGAVPVTYGAGLADRIKAALPDPPDAVIDLFGTETVEAGLRLGTDPSRIVAIAARDLPGGARRTGAQDARPDALARIASGLASGELILPIAATFPVARLSDAVALQRRGHVRGKVVVTLVG